MKQKNPYEYINDFLYFVIKPEKNSDEGLFIYCSGVNLIRFSPITRGRHGLFSNPTFRMLQLIKHSVSAIALSQGASPKTIQRNDCAGIAPTQETWYTEMLLIENAPDSLPEEIIKYCVIHYLRKLIKSCLLHVDPPDTLLTPDELQAFLERLCSKYR